MTDKANNILILFAHPEFKSFNGLLRNTAKEYLEKKGSNVKVFDLYQSKFDSNVGGQDFVKRVNIEHLDYQSEQKHASLNDNYTPFLKSAMNDLMWADYVIMQFPLYWFDVPAVLKGWIEKVIAYYFAYGGNKNLEGKKLIISTTTGGPAESYKEKTLEDFLLSLTVSASFTKMEVLPIFASYGIGSASKEQKDEYVKKFKEYLEKYVVNKKE